LPGSGDVGVEIFIETLNQHILQSVHVRGVVRNAGQPAPAGSVFDATGIHAGSRGAIVPAVDQDIGLLPYVACECYRA
jgi:hypothetical protein